MLSLLFLISIMYFLLSCSLCVMNFLHTRGQQCHRAIIKSALPFFPGLNDITLKHIYLMHNCWRLI